MTVRKIAVLPGDGIGPEVVAQALHVLRAVEQKFSLSFELEMASIGGAAIEATGVPLPESTLNLAQQADAVFLGAVGGPQYDTLDPAIRPEQGLLQIRKAMGLFANLRPVKAYACLSHMSTLKPHVLEGIDIMVVRELTGGLYFGQPRGRDGEKAFDTMVYTKTEVERIARIGFELARKRRGLVCSVDKANVLASSQLWREVVTELHQQQYSDVGLSHMYVDNAAMQLVLNPKQFDVLLTENMFGDILSDEASMLIGSLGMLASASLGHGSLGHGSLETGRSKGLYEPSHGSSPPLAGLNKANPIATILSLKLMLELGFGLKEAASHIESAILQVLEAGYRTADIASPGESLVIGTEEMGDRIANAVLKSAPVQV